MFSNNVNNIKMDDLKRYKYNVLIAEACTAMKSDVLKDVVLGTLKNQYGETIKSPRRMEAITTVDGMLRIMEKRLLLSPDDVAPLENVQGQTGSTLLRDALQNYKNALRSMQQPHLTKQHAVDELLMKKLGSYWKKFARKLDVQECEIERICSEGGADDDWLPCIERLLPLVQRLYPDFQERLIAIKYALECVELRRLKMEIENVEYSKIYIDQSDTYGLR